MQITARVLPAGGMEAVMPQLVALLLDTVNQGVPLGFLPPINARQAELYWRLVRRELESNMRVLVVAFRGDRIAGTGQLALAQSPNAWHRAEVQKLLVASTDRGVGIGRVLIESLHEAALGRRRTLLVLHTRRGQPAVEFYRSLGYSEAGIIPGYSLDPDGTEHDDVTMFQQLTPAPVPVFSVEEFSSAG